MSLVLLIDDDVELAALTATYLDTHGFSVHIENEAPRGVAEALTGHYAIAVVDLTLPRLEGLEALRCIRARSNLPVLMLMGRGEDVDRITGLELGADDCVAKPCTPRELAARIRAILRRTHPVEAVVDRPPGILVSGGLALWPDQRRAEWLGEDLPLTEAEFHLLEVLLRHVGRPVSKNVLSQHALGRPVAKNDRSVDVHLSSIRRKLGPRAEGRSLIRSVHGRGYQLLLGH
jgi:two-component system, OmpR family, response regulator